MEIIKSETLALAREPFEDEQSSSFEKEDGSKQINLFYQQYALRQSSPLSSNQEQIYELHSGLIDKNSQIREQTLTELLNMVPNLNLCSESKIIKEIFPLVTINLGHIEANVRQISLDVIVAFVKHSNDSESVIKYMMIYGVDATTADNILSLNTIRGLPVVLKNVKSISKRISHQLFAHIVTSLSKRMVQITHQKEVVAALSKIRYLIGKSMFDHFLETYYPQIKRDFDVLCNVYDEYYSDKSDESDVETAEITRVQEQELVLFDDEDNANDSFTLKKDYEDYINSDDDVIMKVYDEDGNEIRRTSSRRVTFGGEIVKIRTPDSDVNVITDTSEEKLDISTDIIVHIASDECIEKENENGSSIVIVDEKIPKRIPSKISHIPLPIHPALHKPRHPRNPFRQPKTGLLNGDKSTKADFDLLMDIPNYDGESLTSSSDSSDQNKLQINTSNLSSNNSQKILTFKTNASIDLKRMKINDKLMAENLFNKNDWRYYICGIERLSEILRQYQNILSKCSQNDPTLGVSLLCYLFNSLLETKNNRVISSSLRLLRYLCQLMQSSVLALYLGILIPTFCSYLGCTYENTIRLEAVEILKTFMRKFSPQTIVNFLFTEQCFLGSSSKMRENSLLCLMYALITFPSIEFDVVQLTNSLIEHGITEPKRRVRQALLDTLSILGQFIPRSKLKIPNSNEESCTFKKALRARLTRRQLPTVSANGLISYAFQISQTTVFGKDVEWILAGKGSLSDNYNKRKALFNYPIRDDMSPILIENSWNNKEEKRLSVEYSKINKNDNFCSLNRGNSEEVLPAQEKCTLKKTGFERCSADWTDSHTTPLFFETIRNRYSSNFSDSSSYASSCASDQNLSKLQPAYESSLDLIRRPVSEDKLNRITPSLKYKYSSKLPIRLESCIHQLPIHYNQYVSSSLPILNDKKSNNLQNMNEKQTNNNLTQEKNDKWLKNQEKQFKKNEQQNQTEFEKNLSDEYQLNVENNINQKYENDDGIEKIDEKIQKCISSKEDGEDVENVDSFINDEKRNMVENLKSRTYINELYKEKSKKYLERKAGVRLKRSLTKEIKIPQSTFSVNPDKLLPFEHPKEGLQKTLFQFESNQWETVIEALQGVIRLTKHHNEQLSACLHPYVIAVSKEIKNLRSQVARAACLSAENIFKNMDKISDQDIDELSHSLFLRTADTNKFLREDSNKALDTMIDNVKFSKCITVIIQKVANHPNALIRASAARLLSRLLLKHGASKLLTLTKDKKELVLNTSVKFLMDSNFETRSHGRNIFLIISKDRRTYKILSELIPSTVMASINKNLSRVVKK